MRSELYSHSRTVKWCLKLSLVGTQRYVETSGIGVAKGGQWNVERIMLYGRWYRRISLLLVYASFQPNFCSDVIWKQGLFSVCDAVFFCISVFVHTNWISKSQMHVYMERALFSCDITTKISVKYSMYRVW